MNVAFQIFICEMTILSSSCRAFAHGVRFMVRMRFKVKSV
jgi:hypothetical protein